MESDHPFNDGDRVECVEADPASGIPIAKGKRYTVCGTFAERCEWDSDRQSPKPGVYLREVGGRFFASRFKIVAAPPAPAPAPASVTAGHTGEPPITATAAIKFAVEKIDDHYDRLDFLSCWLVGGWQDIRENWPDAFDAETTRGGVQPAAS